MPKIYGTVWRSAVSQNETSPRSDARYTPSGTANATRIALVERRRGLKSVKLRSTMDRSLSKRVVVAESFAEQGLAILREAGITVDSMVGRSRDDLKASLGTADGLIVRSETGVDSIDVPAATDAGVVVLNTPAANTLSAVELTFGLMISLARHIPRAAQSLREGRWDRLKLV